MKNNEAGSGRFFYLYFLFFITHVTHFFSSPKKDRWKAFQTDEVGPGKQLTFFPLSD